MPVEFKKTWTETDVTALIGQTESIRREFKAGVMFDREPESKWVETLSKEVSALANTEGGELILGLDEDKKSRPRVAIGIDGVTTKIAPERLQQLIEGNVSPYLPGMRVHRIKLSATVDRVVFVIQVPQGNTAYQANDGRYYGRSEFEAKYLPDHEIRLRMQRGRTPQALLELATWNCSTADEDFERRQKIKENVAAKREAGEVAIYGRGIPTREALEAPKRGFDEYEFQFAVVNTGELTIRDFVLCLRLRCPIEQVLFGQQLHEVGSETRYRFEQAADMISMAHGPMLGGGPAPPRKLFSGDRVLFPESPWSFRVIGGRALDVNDLILDWTIFLEDTAPIRGLIDFGGALEGKAHGNNG